MNDKQRRIDERDQRVEVYMDAAAEDFPEDSKGGIQAARLKGLRAQAAALDLARGAGTDQRRQGTEGREETRIKLRQMVKTTWDTHKTIALDHPDIKGLFQPPSKSNNDQMLVRAARLYADTAATLAGLFTEYELTPAFFNDVRALADKLQAHSVAQDAGGSAGKGANAGIDETQRKADKVVARIDTVVRNKYRDDPAKLAAWESASRVESAPRHKPDDDDDEPPPPPPANG